MSLDSFHDDRFDREGDHRVSSVERQDAQNAIDLVEASRQRIRDFVRAEADRIGLEYPRLIDVKCRRTPTFPLQIDEAIEGFVDIVSDDFGDLLSGDELESLRHIAETGEVL